jgi:hypothetical protein
MTLHPGRHFGWWAEGRYANGHLFMKTWWPTEGLARAAARLVGGGRPVQTTRPPGNRTSPDVRKPRGDGATR